MTRPSSVRRVDAAKSLQVLAVAVACIVLAGCTSTGTTSRAGSVYVGVGNYDNWGWGGPWYGPSPGPPPVAGPPPLRPVNPIARPPQPTPMPRPTTRP